SLQSSVDNTILSVQSLYYDLLKQIKLYEANKVAVERSEGQLNRTQKMFDLGAAAKLDVYQAKVNLGNDRITLLSQKNIVADARRNLNLALGREPGEPIEIKPVDETTEGIRPLNELLDEALTNQPLIKQGEAEIESSELGVSLAKANYYPSLSAYFQYSRRNQDLERIYTDLNFEYVWAVGISLNWNVFNGFNDFVNVQKSKLRASNTREAQALYLRQLKSSVKAKYDNYVSYQEIVKINEENLEAAKEELRLAEERYQIGAGTSLEVREAQVKLTRAEQTLIAARYNALIILAQLDTELGITQNKLGE
ncbi:TolC family protein, partial [bacterium BMS3Abin03]|nr:TolC family protein [bacterium BMS3Abin03]